LLPGKSADSYAPLGANADFALDALSGVYRFILFESEASKKGTRAGAPDEANGSNGRPAKRILPD
jgi:hypothetical protein